MTLPFDVLEITKFATLADGRVALELDLRRKMLRHRVIRAAEDARQLWRAKLGKHIKIEAARDVKSDPLWTFLEILKFPGG